VAETGSVLLTEAQLGVNARRAKIVAIRWRKGDNVLIWCM
jgi:hypothetical protein